MSNLGAVDTMFIFGSDDVPITREISTDKGIQHRSATDTTSLLLGARMDAANSREMLPMFPRDDAYVLASGQLEFGR